MARDPAALEEGLVIAGHGRHYVVETPEAARLHARPRGKRSECVVGDRVRVLPTAEGEAVIEHVEARRNLLSRQDAWKSKAFAANIDQLLVIVAAEPAFSESQLARALIAAEAAGIAARIVLNKKDLPAIAAARARLAPYRTMGVEVHEVSLKKEPDAARAELGPLLAGRVTLAIGPSGAGKSTLINRFAPDAAAQVGEISRALNSGRHTTTTTQWYWLDAARSAALIDSPGFQEFGLHHVEARELASLMPDLREPATRCRFYNCTHLHEPGCGVLAAVQAGTISASRHRIYREIREELDRSRW